ncbi:MAG: DNA translocase FtsK [Bacillota bacterium]|nr:DNA translocase FtsK [Bacillota bacterium]
MTQKKTAKKTNNTKNIKKKNTASKSKANAKKQPAAKGGKAVTVKRDSVNRELYVMGFAAVAIILFMIFLLFRPGDTIGGVGVVGLYLSNFFAMLFGKGRYVFPFLLLALAFFIWEKDKEGFPFKRCTAFSFILFISIVAFMNISQPVTSFGSFIITASAGTMGGVVGGLFSYLLLVIGGRAVGVAILLILMLVSLVAITGLSFFGLMKKTGKQVRKAADHSVKAINKAVKEHKNAKEEEEPDTKKKKSPSFVINDADDKEDWDFAPVVGQEEEPANLLVGMEREPVDVDIEELGFPPVPQAETIVFDEVDAFDPKDGYVDDKLDILTYEDGEDSESGDVLQGDGNTKEADVSSPPYVLPKTTLLPKAAAGNSKKAVKDINASVDVLEKTLASFGVNAKVTEVTYGPSLTRYEVQPGPGVKVSKIVNLADDIALQLAATGIRMEAPVPGKSVIGIEVPRTEKTMVSFRDIIENSRFFQHPSKLTCAFGKDITGKPVIGDLAEMPHLLIAGTTGSGKSVCVNTIICSILFKSSPDEVKFIMIDPKQVEFVVYEGLPHLITPVVTDPKKAAGSLKWVLREMENRYTLFNQNKVRNLEGYNELVGEDGEKLPQVVVFIDELADLMMVAAKEVEDAICRLAQKARAAGIHLVVATQRPSVDVITGLIKANMPSRIALSVSSQTDSRTILDMGGAEKLMGKGDMLYFPVGMAKPLRVQGAFLDERIIKPIVEHCKGLGTPEYIEGVAQPVESAETQNDAEDELFHDAAKAVIHAGKASTSMLQRRFRKGYNRAARLIEELQDWGIVGPADGAKPRAVLMSIEAFEAQYGLGNEQRLFDE